MSKFITVYDYADREFPVEIPDKKIESIFVRVLTGDETGFIDFVDGTSLMFDASDCRVEDFYDGSYIVEGEDIEKWLTYKPSGERTCSYERQELFD